MDAVNQVKVWFGGTYRENWTADYHMSVVYYGREYVTAEYTDGKWIPAGGSSELCKLILSDTCPKLTRIYFEAGAKCYAAVRRCLTMGLGPERLWECMAGETNPLAAAELMRLLMDDCGYSMDTAYQAAASCCEELAAEGIEVRELYELQPRLAHVVSLLREKAGITPACHHDSTDVRYRSIPAAARCGDKIRLSFACLGGSVSSAALVLWSDEETREYPMERAERVFSAEVRLPDVPAAMWYAFRIESGEGTAYLCPDETGFRGRLCGSPESGFRLTVYERGFDTPAWFRGSVMYQIFPDRFAPSDDDTARRGIEYHRSLGQTPQLHESWEEPVRWQPREFEKDYSPDDFYGGTFKGIESKLTYLKELGISCIYLNPIVEARSNHRYDTSDYHRPDPILGTMEDFRHLCAAASEMGMRIILDGVFSHTGADSRYFDRYGNFGGSGACAGESSPYYPWYSFEKFPEKYKCWWGFKDLPEVNELDPVWQRDIVTGTDSVVRLWLREGAAGWRLDVADELPDEVLSLIRRAAKSEKPDAPIIGEVWEDAVIKESYGSRRRYALGTALDSVMNYPFRKAVIDFVKGRASAYELRDFLISQQMNYPKPMYYSLMNLLGTHDVPRIRTELACDRDIRTLSREEQAAAVLPEERLERAVKQEMLCAAIQFSVPGVPCIYYGDEQGMCGMGDPFNRMPFREDRDELRAFYASLAETRNSSAAMRTGDARFVACSPDILCVVRSIRNNSDAFGAENKNEVYITAANRGECCGIAEVCPENFSRLIPPMTAFTVKVQ